MFSQVSVILLTGGVCLSACWDTHPPEQTPPGADKPRTDTPPRADTPLEQTPPESRHSPKQTPLGADTPWEQTPPGQTDRHTHPQSMLGDTVNVRAVRILLECNLVANYFERNGNWRVNRISMNTSGLKIHVCESRVGAGCPYCC